MDVSIDDIFTKVCELEGLLMALKRYGDMLPAATLAELKRKANEVARMANEIPCDEPAIEDSAAEQPPAFKVETETEESPVIEVETVVEEEPAVVEEEPVVVEPPVFNSSAQEAAVPVATPIEEPLRVSDKLHRTMSKDLRRALSLNDRFRYARELFGNEVSKLDTVLDAVEGMDSLDEAEAYLLGDLGLNAEDETVVEFMTIIKNHFL